MISLIATAVAISLQPEVGVTNVQRPQDDVYVEYRLPGANATLHTSSLTYGAAVRLDATRWEVALGWRNLGDERIQANIIADDDYAAGRYKNHRYYARWDSTGNERQLYGEVGYKLELSPGWDLVPTLGVAAAHISWHYEVTWLRCDKDQGKRWNITQPSQTAIEPFAGVALEHGRLGVGLYWLQTAPAHTANDFPGQGESALYARVTYRFGVGK